MEDQVERVTDLLPALKGELPDSAGRFGITSPVSGVQSRAGSPAHYPYPPRDSGL
jgi:hypothetical protein